MDSGSSKSVQTESCPTVYASFQIGIVSLSGTSCHGRNLRAVMQVCVKRRVEATGQGVRQRTSAVSHVPRPRLCRRIAMKYVWISAALVCFASINSADAGLFHKHCGCAAAPSCCAPAPSCAAPAACAPTCAAPAACAPSCCAPAPTCCNTGCNSCCKKSCCFKMPKLCLPKIKCCKVRSCCKSSCCAPTCAAPAACAPTCAAPAACAPTCAAPAACAPTCAAPAACCR